MSVPETCLDILISISTVSIHIRMSLPTIHTVTVAEVSV